MCRWIIELNSNRRFGQWKFYIEFGIFCRMKKSKLKLWMKIVEKNWKENQNNFFWGGQWKFYVNTKRKF